MRVPQLERCATAKRRGFRPALSQFAAYMEHKLQLNGHKPDWRTCSLGYLRGRLNQDLRELDEAVQSSDPYRIYDECADVANFAMMIADAAVTRYRTKQTAELTREFCRAIAGAARIAGMSGAWYHCAGCGRFLPATEIGITGLCEDCWQKWLEEHDTRKDDSVARENAPGEP